MYSKRIHWLDFGKGFTILCVVIFHCTQFVFPHSMLLLRNFLEIFMMPTFFAISGYLYKPSVNQRTYTSLIYKKIVSFFIPYSVFALVLYLLNTLKLVPSQWSFHPNYIRVAFLHGSYLWFLITLFLLFVFIGSVIYLFNACYFINRIVLLIIIISLLYVIKRYMGFAPFLLWLVCFLLGYFMREFKLYQYIHLIRKMILTFIIIWILLIYVQFNLESSKEYLTGSNSLSKYSIIPTLFGIIIMFMIFICANHNFVFWYLCKYGKFTLLIYLVHFPILLVIGRYLSIYITSKWILLLILILLIWMLSIICCKMSKYLIINFIFYPRKYIDKLLYKFCLGKKFLNYIFNENNN